MYILNEQRSLNVIGLDKSIISVHFLLLSFTLVYIERLNILQCTELRLALVPLGWCSFFVKHHRTYV